MMTRSLFALTAVALTGLVVGCGGDDEEPAAGTGGSAGSPGATVQLGGTFINYRTQEPVEGLEICTLLPTGRDPGCALTGADGRIVAPGFPTNYEVLFDGTKDGIYPLSISAVSTEEDITDAVIFPVSVTEVDLLLSVAGLTQEPGKGALSFRASGTSDGSIDGLAEVSVTVSAGTAIYMSGMTLDAAATQTDSTGVGVVLNLEPDTEVTVTFEHATRSCSARMGWTGSADNVRRVPIKADRLSYMPATCQ